MEKMKIDKIEHNGISQCITKFDLSDPKAAILILHGMAEYGGRYEPFARYLQNLGFAVWIPDHRQHGDSVNHDEVGIFSEEDTYEKMIADINSIYENLELAYHGKDIYLLGHSMGTILSRAFIQDYQPGIKKVVLIGSPAGKIKGENLAIFIAKLLSKFSSDRSSFLGGIAFKGYNSRVENSKSDFDWISSDEEVVKNYIEDDKCGYNYNASFYYHLAKMNKDVNTESKMKKFISAPVLFIFGECDPVGEYGVGALKLAYNYNSLNKNFIPFEFANMRHELLNEIEREEVYKKISDFFLLADGEFYEES